MPLLPSTVIVTVPSALGALVRNGPASAVVSEAPLNGFEYVTKKSATVIFWLPSAWLKKRNVPLACEVMANGHVSGLAAMIRVFSKGTRTGPAAAAGPVSRAKPAAVVTSSAIERLSMRALLLWSRFPKPDVSIVIHY